MAAPSLPDIAPSRGARPSTRARIQEVAFGDGYAQRARDGLNHLADTFEYRLDNRLTTDCQAIYDFLAARGGVEPFLYQPPNYPAPVKWVCKTFSRPQWVTPTRSNLSATFEQDFSP